MSDKVSIKTLNGYSLEDVQARQEILELSEDKLDKGSPAAHQQMVTDAYGAVAWEDRTHYDDKTILNYGEVEYDPASGGYVVIELTGLEKYSDGYFIIRCGDYHTERAFFSSGTTGINVGLGTPSLKMDFDRRNGIYTATFTEYHPEEYEPGTVFSLAYCVPTLKQLDEKFLPTTVPVIQTATVGQTIAVKAVDENGKPTEWEAVDGASGGSGGDTDTRKQIVVTRSDDESGQNPCEEHKPVTDTSFTFGMYNDYRDVGWTLKPLTTDELANIMQGNVGDCVLSFQNDKYEEYWHGRDMNTDYTVFEKKPYVSTEWVNVYTGVSYASVVSERIVLFYQGDDAGKMVYQQNSRKIYSVI